MGACGWRIRNHRLKRRLTIRPVIVHGSRYRSTPMKILCVLIVQFLTTLVRLLRPGGAKAIVAESLLLKHQLLLINRTRQLAPNLTPLDRVLLGFWTLWVNPRRLSTIAVILKPSTLSRFHHAL